MGTEGRTLSDLIKSRGVKLTWLSIQASITYPRLMDILRGRFEPREDELQRIAAALNVPLEELRQAG